MTIIKNINKIHNPFNNSTIFRTNMLQSLPDLSTKLHLGISNSFYHYSSIHRATLVIVSSVGAVIVNIECRCIYLRLTCPPSFSQECLTVFVLAPFNPNSTIIIDDVQKLPITLTHPIHINLGTLLSWHSFNCSYDSHVHAMIFRVNYTITS